MKKKTETSKKLAWFSGVCFVLSIIYSVLVFTYGTYKGDVYDFTLPITLITTTGAVFGVTMASYSNKSRYENVIKIQKDFLKEKYAILQEMGMLDNDRAMQEIEEVLSDIDADFDNEKMMANQEVNYNG